MHSPTAATDLWAPQNTLEPVASLDRALTIPDEIVRPLGQGYAAIDAFIALYTIARQQENRANPTLLRSLEQISSHASFLDLLTCLPPDAVCLIEGYSAPDNANSLRDFLQRHDCPNPTLHAIDLYDLPRVFEMLKLPMPDVHFHVANAAYLDGIFRSSSLDLVVQDFLLNCAPPQLHHDILLEVARVLRPGGLALINFSDRDGLDKQASRTAQAMAAEHGFEWNEMAYSLHDLPISQQGGAGRRQGMIGQTMLNATSDGIIHVTPPTGNFEFFRHCDAIFEHFARAGLHRAEHFCVEGFDSHGFRCRRHYCLLVKKNPLTISTRKVAAV